MLRRCGVSEVTTPLWTVAEDATAYASAGFATIGVWLHKLEQPRMEGHFWMPDKFVPQEVVDDAVAAVKDSGLRVSHIVLAGNFTDERPVSTGSSTRCTPSISQERSTRRA